MLVYFRIKTTFLLFEIYNFWFCFSHFWSTISCFFGGALHKVIFCGKFPLITHSILTFFCSVLMNRSFYFFQQFFWKEQRLLNVFKCCIWAKEQLFRSNFATDFCGVNDVTWVGFFSFCEFWLWGVRCFSSDFLSLFLTLQLSSDYFHLLRKDIETIRDILWFSEDVDDISVVLSIKSMPLLIIDDAFWL